MDFDPTSPFRGSDAVRAGHLTWGTLAGPRFRHLDVDTYVAASSDDPLLPVRAAMVRAGPTAVATGWSACALLGLDVAPGPRPVELAVPDRRLTGGVGLIARRRRFAEDDVTACGGYAVTTPLRTAFDLACRSGRDGTRFDPVIDPLADAVAAADALARCGGFGADDLARYALDRAGTRGVRRVRDVAALLDPRADSPPESRMRVGVVLAGLPRPVVRYEIREADGWLRYELDLAWEEFRVAAEYDGWVHARDDRRWRDVDRLDWLRRDGWLLTTVTSRQQARPLWVARRVQEDLLARGWVPDPDLATEWQHIMVNSPFGARWAATR